MQPEFYSSWFDCVGYSYIRNDPKIWTPEGYGVFPMIKEVYANAGKTITVNAYLRTGYGVEAYQGLILKPYFPENAKSLSGEILFEQPENADKHLSTKIINPDNSIYESFKDDIYVDNVEEQDWFVVLNPTYSITRNDDGTFTESGFPDDWIRMIELEVTIPEDTPKGTYCIAIKSDVPCFYINQEFYLSEDHEYYGALYFPAGTIRKSNVPHFQLVLNVT
jgi:hypothetical protein